MTEQRRVEFAAWCKEVADIVDKDVELLRKMGERNGRSHINAQLNEMWAAVLRNVVPGSVELGDFSRWDWRRTSKSGVPMRLNPQGFVVAPKYSQANVASLSELLKTMGYVEVMDLLRKAEAHVASQPYRKKQVGIARLKKLQVALSKNIGFFTEMEKKEESREQIIPLGMHVVPSTQEPAMKREMKLRVGDGVSVIAMCEGKDYSGKQNQHAETLPVSGDLDATIYFSVVAERWDELLLQLQTMQDAMLRESDVVIEEWRKMFAGELLAARVRKTLKKVAG